MKKLFLAAAVVLSLVVFAKPLLCLGVRLFVLKEAEGFDFKAIHLSRKGAEVEGLVMTLPLGNLYIETFEFPFAKGKKKVIRGIDIEAHGFDPHPDLWFLKLGVDLEEGRIWFDHLKEPVFFSAQDGVLRVSPDQATSPLLLTLEGYELNEAPLEWLSQFLKWPFIFTQGIISGFYKEENPFDVTLSNFRCLWNDAEISADQFSINDALKISLEQGHLVYREFNQGISVSQNEDGELFIQSGEVTLLASIDKKGHVEGIIGEVLAFTWNGKEGMVRGSGIEENLYGEFIRWLGIPCEIKGSLDVEAWYRGGDWAVDVVSYEGAYLSPLLEVYTQGPVSHAYLCRGGVWSGSFQLEGARARIPDYSLDLHEVKGEVALDGAGGNLSLDVQELRGRVSEAHLEGVFTGNFYRKEGQWGGALRLEGGYGGKGDLRWEEVSCDIVLSEVMGLKNGRGTLVLLGTSEPIFYHGFVDRCMWDEKLGEGVFDARLEKATHDILHVMGTFDREKVYLNPAHSHVFGAKMAKFEANYLEKSGVMTMQSSFQAFLNQFEFLQGCGWLPQYEVRKYDIQGEAELQLTYKKEHLQFALVSESLYGAPFLLQGEVTPEELAIDKFHLKGMVARLLASKEGEGWSLTALEMEYKGSSLKSNQGEWEGRRGGLNLSSCVVNLSDFLPAWNGVVSLAGPLKFNLEEQRGKGSLTFSIDRLSEGDLSVKSQTPLEITYSKEGGFVMQGVDLRLRSGALWAEVAVETLIYNKVLQGEGVLLRLPPEMCLHLAEVGLIPCQREGDCLVVSGVPIKWENQIEARGSFRYDKLLSIQGEMKDAYYWIGERSWPLQNVKFGLEEHAFQVGFKTEYQKVPAYIQASLTFDPLFAMEVALSDEKGRTLRLTGHHHQLIQKLEGEVWGLSANFHHNGKGGLIGLLKVNILDFLEVLPSEWKEKLEPLEIGAGYEIAGEFSFAKEFQFDGHLKGREFQLFGSRLKSLMGVLHIDASTFHLTDLRLSDEALNLSLPELLVHREGEKWRLTIPEVTLADFRPSLLRKVRKYRGKIKPFIIRELKFERIEGFLGEKESFIGHGGLHFTNTFKTENHFFDIPFELIARIGLDPRLLVPVKGTLDFEMRNGKIFLTELKHAHSEGKCSKFYLSQTRPSFITLDGQLDISIKMRQYVILKVTEPFILSVQGSVNQPKYSLR